MVPGDNGDPAMTNPILGLDPAVALTQAFVAALKPKGAGR